jgi:hypothetical protein
VIYRAAKFSLARLLELAGGTNAGCCSWSWWKSQSHPADAIGPARFPGARLIEANRHHPRGILSGAALFIDPTEWWSLFCW